MKTVLWVIGIVIAWFALDPLVDGIKDAIKGDQKFTADDINSERRQAEWDYKNAFEIYLRKLENGELPATHNRNSELDLIVYQLREQREINRSLDN